MMMMMMMMMIFKEWRKHWQVMDMPMALMGGEGFTNVPKLTE